MNRSSKAKEQEQAIDTDREREAELTTRQTRNQLWLAVIEHGSRPISIFLIGVLVVSWLFVVRNPLFDLLDRAQTMKVGSFEVQLVKEARSANVDSELKALEGLNDEQLELFLVIGKQREHITYRGEEVTEINLRRLQEIGLLEQVQKQENGDFWWKISKKGKDLHDIIRRLIFNSIRDAAA